MCPGLKEYPEQVRFKTKHLGSPASNSGATLSVTVLVNVVESNEPNNLVMWNWGVHFNFILVILYNR